MPYKIPSRSISIHAAREGGDLYSNQIASLQGIFQSTPPVKAATFCLEIRALTGADFNPRRPWRRRPTRCPHPMWKILFQSTPPVKAATADICRNGGFRRFQSTPPVKAATQRGQTCNAYRLFQSTPPVKAATRRGRMLIISHRISIHAAREGGDCTATRLQAFRAYFNPRRP